MIVHCPVCNEILQEIDSPYALSQLFELWKPTIFSTDTILEHASQSLYTQLYKCPKCELEIFFPQIIGSPQFYKESYIKLPYSNDKWEFEIAKNDIKNLKSFIEIGCGEGAFLSKIKTIPNIIGIEYNPEAAEIARKNGFTIYNSTDYNRIKNNVDGIALFHVLEHVPNPIDFLKNLIFLLNDDGKIYISVPNQDGPIKYINPCAHNMPPHHATRWNQTTFKVLAQQLNLSIDKITYEPLRLSDHYYYSYYWVNYKFKNKYIRYLLSNILIIIFKILQKIGIKQITNLKGHSIYIIMKRGK